MPNKAAEELARLIEATELPVQSAEQVNSIRRTRTALDERALKKAREKKEAKFATPEALVTAVGAGWLLGPVGGILLGIGQGILGKEAKQNALDQFVAEQDAISGVDNALNSEFDRLAAGATNKEDLAQLSTLQTRKDAAIKFMASASPRLQEQGSTMLSDVYKEMTEYAELQESQKIAADQYDKELQREMDQETYNRFNSMKVRFDDDSQSYEDIIGATNTALTALQDGSPADLWAAGILVNKALDPTSIVRQEEAAAVGALGSIWTKAQVTLEKTLEGTTILPEERNNLIGLLTTIQEGAKKIQLAREARFITELADADVPIKYWDNFKLVSSVPAAVASPVPLDRSKLQTAADTVTGPVTDALEAVDEALNADRRRVTDALEYLFGLPGDRDKSVEELAESNPRARREVRRRNRPHN